MTGRPVRIHADKVTSVFCGCFLLDATSYPGPFAGDDDCGDGVLVLVVAVFDAHP